MHRIELILILFNCRLAVSVMFCNHRNRYSQINKKYKRLGHSSDKTIQRKCCKVTFNFWLQRRPNTLANARISFMLSPHGRRNKVFYKWYRSHNQARWSPHIANDQRPDSTWLFASNPGYRCIYMYTTVIFKRFSLKNRYTQ